MSEDSPVKGLPLLPPTIASFPCSPSEVPLPSQWGFCVKTSAEASQTLYVLPSLSWRTNTSCLRHPDPRSDGVLPFKSTEDTKIVSLLLSLFPSGDRNCYFAVIVPFPLLTFPIMLFFNPTCSEQTSRSGSDTAKTTSGLQSRMQHPRHKSG